MCLCDKEIQNILSRHCYLFLLKKIQQSVCVCVNQITKMGGCKKTNWLLKNAIYAAHRFSEKSVSLIIYCPLCSCVTVC